MRNLPLLLILLLCTCGRGTCVAQSAIPTNGSGSRDQAQVPDTLITVTTAAGSRVANLPYPDARRFPYPQSPGGALSLARGEAPAQSAGRNPSSSLSSSPPSSSLSSSSSSSLSSSSSPSSSLPTPDHEACIQTRHTRLREADFATLTKAHKKGWLKYLPSVSAGLSPALRRDQDGNFSSRLTPTLSIGLNSSLIYQAHRAGQQRAATRESIIKRSQLQEDLEIAKLHRLQRRLQIETDKLDLHVGVTDIDRQLFNLYQQQYDNHDITPEEYLLKRKAFLLQELRNQDQITRIEALQYEIEDLAGCLSIPHPVEDLPSRK